MKKISRCWLNALLVAVFVALTAGCSSESKVTRHVERADKYFKEGQYESAEIEYMNALKLDRVNARAIRQMGLIYFEQGRGAQAGAFLERALELEPNDTEARMKRAFIDLAVGRLEEARAAVEEVLTKEPSHSEAPQLLAETVRTPEDAEAIRSRLAEIRANGGNETAVLLALGTIHVRLGEMEEGEKAFQKALASDAESAAAHHALGSLYWARGNTEEAEPLLKKAAELSEWRSIRRLRYAEFKQKSGDLGEAKRILKEVTENARDYIPAWTRLAEIALAEQDFSQCEALTKEALRLDPNNFEAMLLRGRMHLARADKEKALEVMQRMASIYERSGVVHHQLALAHLLNDDTANALRSVNQALVLAPTFVEAILLQAQLNLRSGDIVSAISRLSALIERNPKQLQAHLMLANAYRAQGSLDQAAASYQRVEELAPDNPQGPLLRGLVLAQKGDKAEARQAFEKALVIKPGFLPALAQLASLDVSEGQYEQAVDFIEAEIQKQPEAQQLHMLLAQIFAAQKQIDKAEQSLLRAIELAPDDPSAYLMLARMYVDSKQNDKALARLRQLLKTNPDDKVALMLTGMIRTETGDQSGARTAYEQLLKIDPKFSPALNNLAYIYSEHLGMLDEALEKAQRARDLLPNDPYTADTLGWILHQKGDYRRAAALLQESHEKLPEQPEVQYHAGAANYMLGDERKARPLLERAATAAADFKGKDEARRMLELLAIDGRSATPAQVALLEERLRKMPQDPVAAMRFAAQLEDKGDFKTAAQVYERALETNRKSPMLLVSLVRAYQQIPGEREKAMGLAREAYALAPEDPEISHLLGRLAFDAGDHKWAVSLLERGTRTGSANPERLHELGVAYHSVGRVEDAQRTIRSALAASADFPRRDQAATFLELITLASDSDGGGRLGDLVRETLAADPANSAALMAAGVIAEQRGDFQGAVERYSRLLELYPNFVPAHRSLALIRGKQLNEPEKAYEHAVKAREAYPNDAEVARVLGIASYSRGDYRRAAAVLREASRAKGQDGEVAFYLGMSLFKLKDTSGAKQFLQKALDLNSSAAYSEEARRILAELD